MTQTRRLRTRRHHSSNPSCEEVSFPANGGGGGTLPSGLLTGEYWRPETPPSRRPRKKVSVSGEDGSGGHGPPLPSPASIVGGSSAQTKEGLVDVSSAAIGSGSGSGTAQSSVAPSSPQPQRISAGCSAGPTSGGSAAASERQARAELQLKSAFGTEAASLFRIHVEERQQKGQFDVYYFHKETNKRMRSKPEVARFLSKLMREQVRSGNDGSSLARSQKKVSSERGLTSQPWEKEDETPLSLLAKQMQSKAGKNENEDELPISTLLPKGQSKDITDKKAHLMDGAHAAPLRNLSLHANSKGTVDTESRVGGTTTATEAAERVEADGSAAAPVQKLLSIVADKANGDAKASIDATTAEEGNGIVTQLHPQLQPALPSLLTVNAGGVQWSVSEAEDKCSSKGDIGDGVNGRSGRRCKGNDYDHDSGGNDGMGSRRQVQTVVDCAIMECSAVDDPPLSLPAAQDSKLFKGSGGTERLEALDKKMQSNHEKDECGKMDEKKRGKANHNGRHHGKVHPHFECEVPLFDTDDEEDGDDQGVARRIQKLHKKTKMVHSSLRYALHTENRGTTTALSTNADGPGMSPELCTKWRSSSSDGGGNMALSGTMPVDASSSREASSDADVSGDGIGSDGGEVDGMPSSIDGEEWSTEDMRTATEAATTGMLEISRKLPAVMTGSDEAADKAPLDTACMMNADDVSIDGERWSTDDERTAALALTAHPVPSDMSVEGALPRVAVGPKPSARSPTQVVAAGGVVPLERRAEPSPTPPSRSLVAAATAPSAAAPTSHPQLNAVLTVSPPALKPAATETNHVVESTSAEVAVDLTGLGSAKAVAAAAGTVEPKKDTATAPAVKPKAVGSNSTGAKRRSGTESTAGSSMLRLASAVANASAAACCPESGYVDLTTVAAATCAGNANGLVTASMMKNPVGPAATLKAVACMSPQEGQPASVHAAPPSPLVPPPTTAPENPEEHGEGLTSATTATLKGTTSATLALKKPLTTTAAKASASIVSASQPPLEFAAPLKDTSIMAGGQAGVRGTMSLLPPERVSQDALVGSTSVDGATTTVLPSSSLSKTMLHPSQLLPSPAPSTAGVPSPLLGSDRDLPAGSVPGRLVATGAATPHALKPQPTLSLAGTTALGTLPSQGARRALSFGTAPTGKVVAEATFSPSMASESQPLASLAFAAGIGHQPDFSTPMGVSADTRRNATAEGGLSASICSPSPMLPPPEKNDISAVANKAAGAGLSAESKGKGKCGGGVASIAVVAPCAMEGDKKLVKAGREVSSSVSSSSPLKPNRFSNMLVKTALVAPDAAVGGVNAREAAGNGSSVVAAAKSITSMEHCGKGTAKPLEERRASATKASSSSPASDVTISTASRAVEGGGTVTGSVDSVPLSVSTTVSVQNSAGKPTKSSTKAPGGVLNGVGACPIAKVDTDTAESGRSHTDGGPQGASRGMMIDRSAPSQSAGAGTSVSPGNGASGANASPSRNFPLPGTTPGICSTDQCKGPEKAGSMDRSKGSVDREKEEGSSQAQHILGNRLNFQRSTDLTRDGAGKQSSGVAGPSSRKQPFSGMLCDDLKVTDRQGNAGQGDISAAAECLSPKQFLSPTSDVWFDETAPLSERHIDDQSISLSRRGRRLPARRVKQPQVGAVACPLCGNFFDPTDIVIHASRCSELSEKKRPANKKRRASQASGRRAAAPADSFATALKPISNRVSGNFASTPSGTSNSSETASEVIFHDLFSSMSQQQSQQLLQGGKKRRKKDAAATTTTKRQKQSHDVANEVDGTGLSFLENSREEYLNSQNWLPDSEAQDQGFLMESRPLLGQHEAIPPKTEKAVVAAAKREQARLEKRAKKVAAANTSEGAREKRRRIDFDEKAVKQAMKADIAIQGVFPTVMKGQDGQQRKKCWSSTKDMAKAPFGTAPITMKPYASRDDAGQFLGLLHNTASECCAEYPSGSSSAIFQFLSHIRLARDGKCSVYQLMRHVKELILELTPLGRKGSDRAEEVKRRRIMLISMFESFLPAFYRMENIIVGQGKRTENSTASDGPALGPAITVRTDSSILWGKQCDVEQAGVLAAQEQELKSSKEKLTMAAISGVTEKGRSSEESAPNKKPSSARKSGSCVNEKVTVPILSALTSTPGVPTETTLPAIGTCSVQSQTPRPKRSQDVHHTGALSSPARASENLYLQPPSTSAAALPDSPQVIQEQANCTSTQTERNPEVIDCGVHASDPSASLKNTTGTKLTPTNSLSGASKSTVHQQAVSAEAAAPSHSTKVMQEQLSCTTQTARSKRTLDNNDLRHHPQSTEGKLVLSFNSKPQANLTASATTALTATPINTCKISPVTGPKLSAAENPQHAMMASPSVMPRVAAVPHPSNCADGKSNNQQSPKSAPVTTQLPASPRQLGVVTSAHEQGRHISESKDDRDVRIPPSMRPPIIHVEGSRDKNSMIQPMGASDGLPKSKADHPKDITSTPNGCAGEVIQSEKKSGGVGFKGRNRDVSTDCLHSGSRYVNISESVEIENAKSAGKSQEVVACNTGALSANRNLVNSKTPYDGSTKPIRPRNAFTHFCREVKPDIQKELTKQFPFYSSRKLKEMVRKEAETQWKALQGAKKKVFGIRSAEDHARYRSEMKVYEDAQLQQKH